MAKRKPHNFNNNFAMKWTLDEISKCLEYITDWLRDDKNGKDCIYIGEALAEVSFIHNIHLYPEVWNYWKNILTKPIGCKPEDESPQTNQKRESVFKLINNIDAFIQSRMISRTLKFKANSTMAIFILKNQGWKDENIVDHRTKGEEIKGFNGEVIYKVFNTNPNIKIDDKGNVLKDLTKQIAETGE